MKVFSGKLVYRTEINGQIIEVRENNTSRWMHFGAPIFQTIIDLKNPHYLMLDYMAVMLGIFQFVPQPHHILLCGLGGGGLVHYLRHYYPASHLTVVEINDTVITTAKDYFYLPPMSDKFSIIHADMNDYLTQTTQKFDLILLDIYTKNKLPVCFYQKSFYEKIYTALDEQGALSVNFLCDSNSELLLPLQRLRLTFNQQTLCLPVAKHNNTIVYAFKSKNHIEKIPQLMETNALSKVQFDSQIGICAQTIKLLKVTD